jgi:hypothetical protein
VDTRVETNAMAGERKPEAKYCRTERHGTCPTVNHSLLLDHPSILSTWRASMECPFPALQVPKLHLRSKVGDPFNSTASVLGIPAKSSALFRPTAGSNSLLLELAELSKIQSAECSRHQ